MAGAGKWRNPDLDLPADFEASRAENYARLRKPLDPGRFTGELREELDAEMSVLNDALGGKGLAWLKIAERCNAGAAGLRPDRPVQADQHDEAVHARPRRQYTYPAGADPPSAGTS